MSKQQKNSPFGSLSDEELVRMYIETQKNVYFEQIYDRYADKVFRKCMSFVKDRLKAEDYTHDIFLRLIMRLNTFKEQAKFSTWLYSITYNYCLDQIRQAKRIQEEDIDENFDVEDDPEDDLFEMQASKLKKGLDKLPADERTILLMKYQDDFSIKEIADNYKLTESAVKMRLKRSKEKLRSFIIDAALFWALFVMKLIMYFKDKHL